MSARVDLRRVARIVLYTTYTYMTATRLALLLLLPVLACSSSGAGSDVAGKRPSGAKPGSQNDDDPSLPDGPGANDLPWEVRSDRGETYVPDVFYAEPSQNEQVMPVAIDGHTQILRLVYPTIGNPNLYAKKDSADSFVMVLRLEDYAIAHLAPIFDDPVDRSPLTRVRLRSVNESNRIAFYLVSRDARVPNTESEYAPIAANGKNIFRIEPSEILAHPMPSDMPEVLKQRRTLRAVFKQNAMAGVPPGLYDVRFEVLKDRDLYGGFHEYQYNAVRVFDAPPPNDEYSVINVTDTQVSVGAWYQSRTQAKLKDFVEYVNASTDPEVLSASFITFNGDLHNGGSPGGFREPFVATTYNEEAKVILGSLKELKLPIFLTAGNHDGYTSTGWVPGAVKVLDTVTFGSLQSTVEDATPKAWPTFTWEDFDAYRTATSNLPGGWHRDIFAGQFTRREGADFKSWIAVPRRDRNMVLYDGFYQWQKTYGPLYFSHRFGKSFFVNMNSFELRQHRRSGWGMYTVNYGGGLSSVQLSWARRELDYSEKAGTDTIVIAHHDPRGGHRGKDFGYYFKQLDYKGVGQSTLNFVETQLLKFVCKLPDWAVSYIGADEDCLHDGLLEWMRPDEEFDCEEEDRLSDGVCDSRKLDPSLPVSEQHHPRNSAYELMDAIDTHASVRTLVLGHTHYDALDILQSGDAMIPDRQMLDTRDVERLAALEVQNPVRGFAWLWKGRDHSIDASDYDAQALAAAGIVAENGHFFREVENTARPFQRVLEGNNRELAILHITCNADITQQTYNGRTNLGFSVLHVTKKTDARAYDNPQVNRVSYFINADNHLFEDVKAIDLDRTARLGANDPQNPVAQTFQ